MKQLTIGLLFSVAVLFGGLVSLDDASAVERPGEVSILVQDSTTGRVGLAVLTSEPAITQLAWNRLYREAQQQHAVRCIGCLPEQDVQTIFDGSRGAMSDRLINSLREVAGAMPHLQPQTALLFISTPGHDPDVFVTAYQEADPILALEQLLRLDRQL